ncbi:MAG: hypothetical protein IPM51_17105 [Sphingobacteriaceae bacterium]|nr:hypothetical protein [Sphingobacteriaceae bacterium]
MRLPLPIAKKLLLLKTSREVSSSQLNRSFSSALISDGILIRKVIGRTKAKLHLQNPDLLDNYLKNKYGINDLEKYIVGLENDDITGKEAVEISNNTKIKRTRHFKGFLINSLLPFSYYLNGEPHEFQPRQGSFLFIHDYETFSIPETFTIIGIENPENFRFIERQQNLFSKFNPIFVSRYPQSGDLITWLKGIKNSYIHFGDFDFAGIHIYLYEFKKHLLDRANYFIPSEIKLLIQKNGNRELYNTQLRLKTSILQFNDPQVQPLIDIISDEKKGLEQQALIE